MIENVRRVYLDTNIFIRWLETDDEISRSLSDMIFANPADREPFFVTSELTFAELTVKPYRERDERLLQLYDNWTISNPALHVREVDRGVLYYSAVLRAEPRSLKLPDAIHLSTAIGCGCSHLLTADTHFSGTYNIFHERDALTRGLATVDVLRPDSETIANLTKVLSS
jgi:predicted nucleic acid-binding protein